MTGCWLNLRGDLYLKVFKNSPVKEGLNCALCDKSTKFGTVVVYGKVTISKIGGTLKSPLVSFGGHFFKMAARGNFLWS